MAELSTNNSNSSSTTPEGLEFFLPSSFPPEIQYYDKELTQIKVGRAGKLGALELGFEYEESVDKTVIKNQYSRVPLYAGRAIYADEFIPSMAYVYIVSPSGGILQGDRYRMDISLKNKAKAHVTTQGATRLYRMEKNFASQVVNISVDKDCYLEYIPDQIIPYVDSRFYQQVNLNVHEEGTLLYSEIVVPGRTAHGEFFKYDIFYMKTLAKDQDGKYRLVDVAILEPKKREQRILGILGSYEVFSNMYILTPSQYVSQICDKVNSRLAKFEGISYGASILPDERGIIVRCLGNWFSDIKPAVDEIVTICREILYGVSFKPARKA